MSNQSLLEELKEFLRNANFTTYEIRAYNVLLTINNMTAREISKKSGVPNGRIYEVLEILREKGLIEVSESRPKIYQAISPNLGFNNLISYISDESKRKASYLIDQAKILENKIMNSNILVKEESTRVFWSTAFGTTPSFSLYSKRFKELQNELLMTGFINEMTPKILKYATPLFEGIKNVLERGVVVKYLWSFEHDERPVANNQIQKYLELYGKIVLKSKEIYNLTPKMQNFEMKFIFKRFPTYFDIFDEKRVIIKLQNPIQPSRILVCLDILDPNLASELKKRFDSIWTFEARGIDEL
ncbi:MAG: TrmB family transcriptional regulator [Candidatus Lokiarchaeota archaeon]|nr:TrmB family transcriptional regulator [Candidatus Lokiarchaeota archaeon]